MSEGTLFDDIEHFLAAERQRLDDDRLLNGGILLALLVMRGAAPGTPAIVLRATDRDYGWLWKTLAVPGLAPDLATVENDTDRNSQPITRLHLHWDAISRYFGKDEAELTRILREQFPALVRRHRLTFAWLLSES